MNPTYKKLLSFYLFLNVTFSMFAQQEQPPVDRERFFTTSIGGTWQTRKDNLFSPLTYQGIGAEIHLGNESISTKWFKQIDVWGGYNQARTYIPNGYNYSAYLFRGGLSYTAMRRVMPDEQRFRWYVGGSVFSNGNGQFYLSNVNNELSYDFPTGFALGTYVQKNLHFWQKNFVFSSQLSLPIVAYNLRPTYIGFSNDNFLTSQTGFVAFPKLLQLDWRTSVELPLSNGNKFRLTYRWEYLDDRKMGRLQLSSQTILFQTLFNIPFHTHSNADKS